MRKLLAFVFSSLFIFPFAYAGDQLQDPYQLVEQTTEQVLAIIKNTKDSPEKNLQVFHDQVTSELDRVIDFDDFARGVMGIYASERHYQTLTSPADRATFRERVSRFTASFKQQLVKTYANGLLNFNGEKIETLPLSKGSDPATGSVSVIQHIYNNSGKPYVIQYSMRRNKNGEWKLKNIVIEGVNLGLIYRNQFASAVETYHGDINKVIENWSVDLQATGALKSSASASENHTK
jgi:phospholipid transport system substrate-binding protein